MTSHCDHENDFMLISLLSRKSFWDFFILAMQGSNTFKSDGKSYKLTQPAGESRYEVAPGQKLEVYRDSHTL